MGGSNGHSLNDYYQAFTNFENHINQLYENPKNKEIINDGFFVNYNGYKNIKNQVLQFQKMETIFDQNGNVIDENNIRFETLKAESLNEVYGNIQSNLSYIIINERLFKLLCDPDQNPNHKIKYKITPEKKIAILLENDKQILFKYKEYNVITKESPLGYKQDFNNNNSSQIPQNNYFYNKLYESIKIYMDNERDILSKLNSNSQNIYQGFLVDNIWIEKWKIYSNYNNIIKLFKPNNINEGVIKNNIRQELLNKNLNISNLDYIDRFILKDVTQLKSPITANNTYILLNAKFINLFINNHEDNINLNNFFISYQKIEIRINNIPFLSFQTNSNAIYNKVINYSNSNSKSTQLNPKTRIPNKNFIQKSNSNEINNLKNELFKANKIIEQQKLTINELQNKLNNYNTTINDLNNNINNYKKIIIQKDAELNNLRTQLNNNNIIPNKVYFNDIMCVNFISSDQNVHYAASCLKTDTFAEIEEKLYKQYPQYRETNNSFLANGTQVLRFKTIAENKIGNGLPVTLIVPS